MFQKYKLIIHEQIIKMEAGENMENLCLCGILTNFHKWKVVIETITLNTSNSTVCDIIEQDM